MTQRLKQAPNSLNLETIACEKYISRLLQREKSVTPTVKHTSTSLSSQKYKEKPLKTPVSSATQNQLSKIRPNVKQQNLPSPKLVQSPTRNVLQYDDESTLVEIPVKAPRHRSRSTVTSVAEREPWGQLLKQQRSSDKVSVFSNFDPLRTLHFLAKELQYQLQAILPDDNGVQQMVADMQYALKRVPPEVASTIHLQQAIDLLPSKKSSRSLDDEKPERLKPNIAHKVTQTPPCQQEEECKKIQRVMEESTIKLETSCKQMETLCAQLKNEKESLEGQLKAERDSIVFLRRRIEDLEFENAEILNHKIKSLEEEKVKLEADLNQLSLKIENQSLAAANSKSAMEQECAKLKHQLRLCAIEKEKYIAVLAVRDRQINEIRTEMTQLQEVVNDQLMDLHNNAFACMPSNANLPVNPTTAWNTDHNKENMGDIGDGTLSTVHSNEDPIHACCTNKPKANISFRDIPSGDNTSNILKEIPKNGGHLMKEQHQHNRLQDSPPYLTRPESQANIRHMFNDLKKTAYSVGNPEKTKST
ncbi:hypothetical protein NQ314_010582 [Rhamnusium bicolor]|uniref:Uncharacterized protein n=1 Tax=Rhamnusium bicolor TaxID=1586634 RepID=A0AAV8XQP7_9CUCU|nr:hypothetical protein NQ314_010582 [Rhamnusium bicolor]